MPDRMKIKILPNGVIRTVTGKFSPVNHTSANEFVKDVSRLAGGEVTRVKGGEKELQGTTTQDDTVTIGE